MKEIQEVLQNKIVEYKKLIPVQKETEKYKLSIKNSKKVKEKKIKIKEYCFDVTNDIKKEVSIIVKDIEQFLKDDLIIYLMMGNNFIEEEEIFVCRIKKDSSIFRTHKLIEIKEYSHSQRITDFKNNNFNFSKMAIMNIKLIKS